MVASTEVSAYSIYNPAPTLLPENIASFITAIALATKLSLRCSSILIEALLESAKFSTSFSIGISRQAIINALYTAKRLHDVARPSTSLITDGPSDSSREIDSDKNGFLQVLDKYTNLGIYIVHHSFTLVELFAMSGLQFTSQSIRYGLMAAEESVAVVDGIFGSNESSRAIASIITLVHRELMNDPEFPLTKIGKVAILSGLTKAMTAFAILQNVTHKRTMKHMKINTLWKGLVVEEEEKKKSQALIEFQKQEDQQPDEQQQQQADIIHELEEILASASDDQNPTDNLNVNTSLISLSSTSSNLNGRSIDLCLDEKGNPYDQYEIVTTTTRVTTKTTSIRPIDANGNRLSGAKQVVERTDEEENEAFVATVDLQTPFKQIQSAGSDQNSLAVTPFQQSTWPNPKHPNNKFKIMLSSVSKKLSRKKVERQTRYETVNGSIERPISTRTSTSTTLHTSTQDKPLPQPPTLVFSDEDHEAEFFSEPEGKSKRRMSWSGLKVKNLTKKKSSTNLLQKGIDATLKKKKKSSPPPLPGPYLQKSNSITSISSMAHTLTTTTYHTEPRTLLKSPSVPSRLNHQKKPNPLDLEPRPQNFPRRHIIHNIAYFIRYASAAYGESFMRILGIGDIPSILPNSHHPNHHAFAHHTGISVQDILLSSYADNSILSSVSKTKLHALVHYVTVDHHAEAIVLTIRGTLGLSDVLTDLTCDYQEFTLPADTYRNYHNDSQTSPRHYMAHGGMLEAAQLLAVQKGKVFETIRKGLEDYPDYGLVICGHSLGAGVASLLSVMWSEERLDYLSRQDALDTFEASTIKRFSCPFVTSEFSGLPSGRPIHCYTYGSPCVMSLALSEYCGQGLVTSVVHAFDIVSGLSLGLLKDFKNVAVSLHEDSHVTDDILSRVVGHFQRKKKEQEDHTTPDEEEEEDQWFWALIKTMRADMTAEKLYPPSTMYLIESIPQLVQHTESSSQSYRSNEKQVSHKRAHMVKFSKCEDIQARFSEIIFSRTMFLDHSPTMYEKAISQLNKGYFG